MYRGFDNGGMSIAFRVLQVLFWLITLKDDLKKWTKEEFGDLAFRKKSLLSELLGLDAREDLLGLSQEDQTRRIQIKGEIIRLASLEEIS